MANQIAANFTNLAPDAAAAAVATHIRSFWAPPMRADLTTWIDEGGEGVDPVAVSGDGEAQRLTRCAADRGRCRVNTYSKTRPSPPKKRRGASDMDLARHCGHCSRYTRPGKY